MSPERINISRASWIHNREGVDYGPYDSQTVAGMVEAGDVAREDALRDQFTGVSCKATDIPLFCAALEAFEAQERESQIAEEAEATYTTLKKRRALIPILLVLVTVLGVATGWEHIQAWMDPSTRHSALAAVTIPLTPDPDVVMRALPSAANAAATSDASSSKRDTSFISVRSRPTRNIRPRRRTRAPRPPQIQHVQEFDFAEEDSAATSGDNLLLPPSASEIREFLSETLKPLVMRCARVHREELVHSSYRVRLKLLPSGSLQFGSISPAGSEIPGLRGCVELLAKRNKFRKFIGAARELELPIKVR